MVIEETVWNNGSVSKRLVECPFCGESLRNSEGNLMKVRHHLPCDAVVDGVPVDDYRREPDQQ